MRARRKLDAAAHGVRGACRRQGGPDGGLEAGGRPPGWAKPAYHEEAGGRVATFELGRTKFRHRDERAHPGRAHARGTALAQWEARGWVRGENQDLGPGWDAGRGAGRPH